MASQQDVAPPAKELVDISKAIDVLCTLNTNDLRNALRTLDGGALGVILDDAKRQRQSINMEKIASTLPRHLLAHIVAGERTFALSHPGSAANGWLAYTAKGLHLVNCLISIEFLYPRLASIQRGLEHRSCVLDLLLLAGAVWNTELAGASSFAQYVLCAEGIRLTSAALGTALQHDLDRAAETNKTKPGDPTSTSSSTLSSPHPSPSANNHTNGTQPQASISTNISNNNNDLPPYSYEWYDALILHPKFNTYLYLPIDTINLLQKVVFLALKKSPDHVPKLCRSFYTQLEAFYLMCCAEEFVAQLLLRPVFVDGDLLNILQQALHLWKSPWSDSHKQALTASGGIAGAGAANAFQYNDPIASVVNQILRVLYVLFEKENPCFLDAVATSTKAFQHMQTIISTVTQMSSRILDTSTCGPSVLESFKLIEILSDDSNFKNEVISRATPLLLQILSFPPSTLEALFTAQPLPASPQQLQRDFMIVVFRVVGNLHCFNEALCKPEDKGLFVRTMVAEMGKHPNNTSTTKQSNEVNASYVLTNLNFLMYRLIQDRQVYHLNTEEIELVTSFTQSLQQTFSPTLPPSSTSLPPSASPLLSSTPGDVSSPLGVNHKRKHTDTLEVQ